MSTPPLSSPRSPAATARCPQPVFCLAALLLAMTVLPAAGVDLSLPDVEAAPGETVLVPMAVEGLGADEILSLNIDLRFNASLLPVSTVSANRRGSLTGAWSLASNARVLPGGTEADGQLLIAGATASSPVSADGSLLFVEIALPADAAIGSVVPLQFGSVLLNNGSPEAVTTDGSLTIVGPRIKAEFGAHPVSGAAPLEVQFEDLSSDDVETWAWDFGDGVTSSDSDPLHLYEAPGSYSVSLTVTAAGGEATETKSDFITVTPDVTAPTIVEGPVVRGITHDGADLFWKTNEAGDSEVVYCGLTFRPRIGNLTELMDGLRDETGRSDAGSLLERGALSLFDASPCGRVADARLQANHNVRLDDLSPATVYIYRVRSTDEAGNASGWRGGLFFTRGRPDDDPPNIVSSVTATVTPTRAQVRWRTDEPGNSFVSYSTDPGFAGDVRVTDDELVTDHRVWIDVEPGTQYFVRVRSTDRSGNSSSLKRGTFRTPRSDEAPVLLAEPLVTRRTASQAVIFVEASEPVTVRLVYGQTEDYGATVRADELSREHRLLLHSLEPRTVYHVRVIVTDASGQQSESDDLTFVTTGSDDGKAPSFVRGPYVLKAQHDQALIAFDSDEDATAVIEYGLDDDYGSLLEVAEPVRRHRHVLTGLSPGTVYLCRVSITDLAGNGPVVSRVLRFRTARQIDDTAPVIIGPVRIARRTGSQLTVEWDTDEASSSRVDYGLAADDLTGQAGDDGLRTEHSVTLTRLPSGTTIYLRAVSSDATGNETVSDIVSATTRGNDNVPDLRILSGPDIASRSATTVVVQWLTDRPATSAVEYGTTVNFESEAVDFDRTRHHRIVLTGLEPATTYFLQATSGDGSEASSVSSRVIEVTTDAQVDDDPPGLRHVSLSRITSSTALVTWRTDEPAGGWVDVGAAADDYADAFGGARLERWHQVLLTGLEANTTYHYRLRAVDAAGNETVGPDATFRTGRDRDRRSPRFTQWPTIVAGHSSATFAWRTDESCFGRVVVGTEATLGTADEVVFESERAGFDHRVTVTGLQAGVRYLFSVLSTDLAGNASAFGNRRGAGKVLRPDNDGGDVSFITDTQVDATPPQFTAAPRELSRSSTEVLIGWQTDEVSDARLYLVEGTGERLVEYIPEHDFAHQALLTGLTPGATYTVVAASYDPEGNGPSRSAPLTFTTPMRADSEPPAFVTYPAVLSLDADVATLAWSTDEAAVATVRYGVDALDERTAAPSPGVEQQLQLSGLAPGETYRFAVDVVDGEGNQATSRAGSFTTPLSADDQPPTITAAPSVDRRTTRATVAWRLDEGGDGFVRFGTDPDSLTRTAGAGTQALRHAVELTRLLPATTYYYQVSSADAWGNGPAWSVVDTFTTLAAASAASVPTRLKATMGAHGIVRLRWDAAGHGSGWRVYRSTGGDFEAIAGPLYDPTYVDRGVAAAGNVRYRVTAVGSDGTESGPSAEAALAVTLRAGDLNDDGLVDLDDFFVLVQRLGSQRTDAGFDATSDFDGDGVMGLDDIFVFVELYGINYGRGRAAGVAGATAAAVQLQARDVGAGRWTIAVTGMPSTAWGLRLEYENLRLIPSRPATAAGESVVLQETPGILDIAGFGDLSPRLGEWTFEALPGTPPGRVRLARAAGVDAAGQRWRTIAPVETAVRPTVSRLLGSAPNPFNPSTQIRFQLAGDTPVWLTVYDALGRVVARLAEGDLYPAGLHALTWNGRDSAGRPVASGLYLTLLQTPQTRSTGKLLLLR
jgi:PKD repeat protein